MVRLNPYAAVIHRNEILGTTKKAKKPVKKSNGATSKEFVNGLLAE